MIPRINSSDLSYKTARHRKTLSRPMRYLLQKNLLVGSVLDYGCGFGFDAQFVGADGFDPYYQPDGIRKSSYNTITCIYVLNVLQDPSERLKTLCKIDSLLEPQGIAYIAVRNDKRSLLGTTSIGTWQGLLDDLPFPTLTKNSSFILYSYAQHYRLF